MTTIDMTRSRDESLAKGEQESRRDGDGDVEGEDCQVE